MLTYKYRAAAYLVHVLYRICFVYCYYDPPAVQVATWMNGKPLEATTTKSKQVVSGGLNDHGKLSAGVFHSRLWPIISIIQKHQLRVIITFHMYSTMMFATYHPNKSLLL